MFPKARSSKDFGPRAFYVLTLIEMTVQLNTKVFRILNDLYLRAICREGKLSDNFIGNLWAG